MGAIRKVLVKVLGLKSYLVLISSIYLFMIRLGFFKKKHAEIHFLKSLVTDGDVCIDIGANLGYYSKQLVRLTPGGEVHAVEPIPLFQAVWKRNIGNRKNAQMHPVALGDQEKTVKMVIPMRNGVVRHGLTKVVERNEQEEAFLEYDVEMRRGNNVFSGMTRLDFIKCDVEGYEQFVMPELADLMKELRPIVQIELNGEENRSNVTNLMVGLSYQPHILKEGKLHGLEVDQVHDYNQDFYFLPKEKLEGYSFCAK